MANCSGKNPSATRRGAKLSLRVVGRIRARSGDPDRNSRFAEQSVSRLALLGSSNGSQTSRGSFLVFV